MSWGNTKTTPNFYDLLGELTGLSRQSYSWLRFITVKRYRARSTKAEGSGYKVREKPGTSFLGPSPGAVTKALFNSPEMRCEMLSTRGAL